MLACVPQAQVADDSGSSPVDDTGGGATGGQSTAVLATVSEDYAVGALATVGLDDWAVDDQITDLTGDPAVVVSGGRLFQLNRYGYDTVRIYELGAWAVPLQEFALEDLANPVDVEVCGGKAFISQYGLPYLAVFDPESGAQLDRVDLSAWDDGDGTPEAGSMVQVEDRLYVALENLDRSTDWLPVGGAVLEVDCASQEVTAEWAVNGPSVFEHPAHPEQLVVHGWDQGLYTLDTSSGELSALRVDQATLGGQVGGLAAWGDHAVLTVYDDSYDYRIGCLDLSTWSWTPAEDADNFLTSVRGNDHGEAWIAARTHWETPEAPNGMIVYDIESCSSRTAGSPVETLLAPVSVAFY